jgi:ATP-dependent exoDNAse (exonuclease V) beta subunit
MTRAIHAMHMIVAPSKGNERTIPSTYAGLLRAVLTDGKPTAPTTGLYEHGDPRWFTKTKPRGETVAASGTERDQPLVIRLAESPARAMRGLERRSPSQLEGGPLVNLTHRLRLDESTRFDRGTLLHAWFQQIEWLDDGKPEDALLRSIAAGPEFRGLDVEALLKEFYAVLEKPAIRAVLSRSTYRQPPQAGDACAVHATGSGKRWQVWRERPFAVRDGDAILNGKIDRLVMLYDGDQIVAADVVDYKTDTLPAGKPRAVDARAEIYRPQLEAYRRATSKLCRLAPDRISARLLFVAAGHVKSL